MLCGAICAATTQAQVPGFWNECYVVDSRFNTQPNSLENDAANVVHGSVVLHTHTACAHARTHTCTDGCRYIEAGTEYFFRIISENTAGTPIVSAYTQTHRDSHIQRHTHARVKKGHVA